jgi:hypothetical protein
MTDPDKQTDRLVFWLLLLAFGLGSASGGGIVWMLPEGRPWRTLSRWFSRS